MSVTKNIVGYWRNAHETVHWVVAFPFCLYFLFQRPSPNFSPLACGSPTSLYLAPGALPYATTSGLTLENTQVAMSP